MGLPICVPQLIRNQFFRRVIIGNAQQGFRQTHQHHALFRRQVIFRHEGIQQSALVPAVANRLHQGLRPLVDTLCHGGLHAGLFEQHGDHVFFTSVIQAVDFVPEGVFFFRP